MAAAKIAGYIAPYLVKEAMDMAKPKVKGFFTKEEHTHTDGSKSTQEIKGDIQNGKAKNIEVNTKSDASMTPVKETKVTYKLKK